MNEKSAFPSDSADKVLVRMPDGMRSRLKDEAKGNNRTMNAEIVTRLQASFGDGHLGMELGSIGDKLTAAKQELEKAQKNLDDSATNIADKMLDRMHERGLVFKKGIVDGASITSTILGESPNTHEGS